MARRSISSCSPVAAVHLDDGGLVTIGVGIRAGATECLGPVSSESLDMLGVEAVAERMADHVVGHHPTMPGAGKTLQSVVATRRFENSLHTSIMTIVPSLCKTIAASGGGKRNPRYPMGARLSMAPTSLQSVELIGRNLRFGS